MRMDAYGYVYAKIPSNTNRDIPALGFIAHMDTSPALSGRDVKPQLVKNYDGGDICLNQEHGIVLSPADFPELLEYKGQTLVTTDGTTLLGADDKAGAAEIMSMAAWLLAHPEKEHGDICIAFTPDEEVGRGADLFDVDGFGAQAPTQWTAAHWASWSTRTSTRPLPGSPSRAPASIRAAPREG